MNTNENIISSLNNLKTKANDINDKLQQKINFITKSNGEFRQKINEFLNDISNKLNTLKSNDKIKNIVKNSQELKETKDALTKASQDLINTKMQLDQSNKDLADVRIQLQNCLDTQKNLESQINSITQTHNEEINNLRKEQEQELNNLKTQTTNDLKQSQEDYIKKEKDINDNYQNQLKQQQENFDKTINDLQKQKDDAITKQSEIEKKMETMNTNNEAILQNLNDISSFLDTQTSLIDKFADNINMTEFQSQVDDIQQNIIQITDLINSENSGNIPPPPPASNNRQSTGNIPPRNRGIRLNTPISGSNISKRGRYGGKTKKIKNKKQKGGYVYSSSKKKNRSSSPNKIYEIINISSGKNNKTRKQKGGYVYSSNSKSSSPYNKSYEITNFSSSKQRRKRSKKNKKNSV